MIALSARTSRVIKGLRSHQFEEVGDRWVEVGHLANVGRKTLKELMTFDDLEFSDLPKNLDWGPYQQVRVRVRGGIVRPESRVVALLEEILAVLKGRL